MASSFLEAIEIIYNSSRSREVIATVTYVNEWKHFFIKQEKTSFLPPVNEIGTSRFIIKAYEAIVCRSSEKDSSEEIKLNVMNDAIWHLSLKMDKFIKNSFTDLKRNQRKKRHKEAMGVLIFLQQEGVLRRIAESDPKLTEFIMRVGLLPDPLSIEILLLLENKVNILKQLYYG